MENAMARKVLPRTKEEWEEHYRKFNYTPWDDVSPEARYRYSRTIDLILSEVDFVNHCNIVDFGCFKGEFTSILAMSFPGSRVFGCDISEEIIAMARERCAKFPNVEIACSDMIGYEAPAPRDGARTLFLFMECLYYLKPEEKEAVLRKVRAGDPNGFVVISAPIVGPPYLSEKPLLDLMGQVGYQLKRSIVLNSRAVRTFPRIMYRIPKVRPLNAVRKWLNSVFCHVAEKVTWVRRLCGNHCVYVFVPVAAEPAGRVTMASPAPRPPSDSQAPEVAP
jgi:SAM-dependent methyltransferase